jgi:ribosomal protein S18 acetylase RimI-like enzyme
MGHDAVWLGVWASNPRAQAFYRKHRFAYAGDSTFMMGRDVQHDLVLVRSVP